MFYIEQLQDDNSKQIWAYPEFNTIQDKIYKEEDLTKDEVKVLMKMLYAFSIHYHNERAKLKELRDQLIQAVQQVY